MLDLDIKLEAYKVALGEGAFSCLHHIGGCLLGSTDHREG